MKELDGPSLEAASAQRQRLRAAYEELGALLPAFFSREPLFQGYAGERTVRCGKPTCHCADGPGHRAWTVNFKEGGKSRNRVLPPADRERVTALAETYRGVRAARARWRELVREIDELFDTLVESRSVPYAPGKESSE